LAEHFIPISRPGLDDAEKAAVMEVLESGMLVQGAKVAALEERFCRLVGVKHAVAVSSGTAGLHLALLAHGIGSGDEVITSSFTFIASANSVLYAGARPVFADVDPATFNLDPSCVEAAITGRTKAIMPVHLYGQTCDMEPLLDIARHHGLLIVEDAAQAVGATYRGRPAGSFGTGVFSLYATKNVMSAEGGIVTTDDDTVDEMLRLLRNHGMAERYHHRMLGYNFRMTDLHAAIGLSQMDKLERFTGLRRRNAEYLSSHVRGVLTPAVADGRGHVWHQYTVRFEHGSRDAAVQKLNAAGIGTGIFYPIPAHQQPYMRQAAGEFHLPNTERLAAEVLSLPVHPSLMQEDLDRIVGEVNRL
jgi:perosamine synthetase